jgi:hypothetical protein
MLEDVFDLLGRHELARLEVARGAANGKKKTVSLGSRTGARARARSECA